MLSILRALSAADDDMKHVMSMFPNIVDIVARRTSLRHLSTEAQLEGISFLRNILRFPHLAANVDPDSVNYIVDIGR